MKRIIILLILGVLFFGCTQQIEKNNTTTDIEETKPIENETIIEEPIEEPEEKLFKEWWQNYSKPITVEYSSYPTFYRGAWASRLDEMRDNLINAEKLRQNGFDTIMLNAELVFWYEDSTPKLLCPDITEFYIQAFKKQGFRVMLIPNSMHPNENMCQGEGSWANETYFLGKKKGYTLLEEFNPMILELAEKAEYYDVYAYGLMNEPHNYVLNDTEYSQWMQEIKTEIKEKYSGKLASIDIMDDYNEPGTSRPYDYNYEGFDIIISGPPAGMENVDNWKTMFNEFVEIGDDLKEENNCETFAIYEWGGYTGGCWYEQGLCDIDQCLSESKASQIVYAGTQIMDNQKVGGSFTRISKGWFEIDTKSFNQLSVWYTTKGKKINTIEDKTWTYEELKEIEEKLCKENYKYMFEVNINGSEIERICPE